MGDTYNHWLCTKCENTGTYYGEYEYPRGWRFSLVIGLVCPRCAKKYNIKISDVEQETVKSGNVDEITWECL